MEKSTEALYDLNAGTYCGITMPKHVMIKIAKSITKHNAHIKEILRDHMDEIYSSEWTLTYPDGVQQSIHYALDCPETVERRIHLFSMNQPTRYLDMPILTKDEHYNSDEVLGVIKESKS